jgi:hypothetical protein
MTYIIKTMNDRKVGIYDTERACFPIAGPELREAGITRISGDDDRGWFTPENRAEAERIAALLNEYHGHGEYAEAKVTKPKAKVEDEESLRKVGEALIESERAARAS